MRNATISDVKKAQEERKLQENVMYGAYGYKVHGKPQSTALGKAVALFCKLPEDSMTIAETANGQLIDVAFNDLRPLSKGPAQQPKKPKRKPVKGTKPEKLVPFVEGTILKKGDKVVLSNGKRGTVTFFDESDPVTPFRVAHTDTLLLWHKADGKANISGASDITHVVVPYSEWAMAWYEDLLGNESAKVKTKEQEDFEKGYWIPWVATRGAVCPEWLLGQYVAVMFRKHPSLEQGRFAEDWGWSEAAGYTIIAYRKAQQ